MKKIKSADKQSFAGMPNKSDFLLPGRSGTGKAFCICLAITVYLSAAAQNQVDFRGLFSVHVEKKISRSVSFTFMNEEILTYDFQELGFFFFDAGMKYKFNRSLSVNGNYRFLFRRNLDNFYDNRQVLYGDIDFVKGKGNWTFGGTVRIQSVFYTHVRDGYRPPLIYNRDKVKIGCRINYYLQPFIEAEVFFPLNHPVRKTIDQIRGSAGLAYTINRHVKLEVYEQIQQQLNRAPRNTNYVTAVNWYFRF
ncbi:MAG TPA: DUF2490 domain-containing protein [Chitinophagales bacterium]|nr:DUF2490 domain-containing protein [Chitinophagales bacterium]